MAPSSSPHDDVPKFGRTRHGSRRIARSTSAAPRGAPAGTGQCSARKAARGLRVCMRKIREPLSCAQRALSGLPSANWGARSILNQNDSTISILTRQQLAAQCRGRHRLQPICGVALAPLAARPRGRDLQLADAVQYRRAAPSATAHC